MGREQLWQRCSQEQCREMVLSLGLLGGRGWEPEKVMACLYALGSHTERHYTALSLPKKSGGRRFLSAPDPLLKEVQRDILVHVLSGFSAAPLAMAYRRGISIFDNGRLHEGKAVVMKLDIEDFFGSITFPMVLQAAFPAVYFPPSVGGLLTALCCLRDRLPQGAPTSPAISNLVMRPFDRSMAEWCEARGITYSRYSDDMTFSGEFDPGPVLAKAENFLRTMGFSLQRRKTCVLRGSARRIVTGLAVNERAQAPREYRRRLRQQIWYCRRYGAREQVKRQTGREEVSAQACRRWLEVLLGRTAFVLQTRPEDAWFGEAREWLLGELGASHAL